MGFAKIKRLQEFQLNKEDICPFIERSLDVPRLVTSVINRLNYFLLLGSNTFLWLFDLRLVPLLGANDCQSYFAMAIESWLAQHWNKLGL